MSLLSAELERVASDMRKEGRTRFTAAIEMAIEEIEKLSVANGTIEDERQALGVLVRQGMIEHTLRTRIGALIAHIDAVAERVDAFHSGISKMPAAVLKARAVAAVLPAIAADLRNYPEKQDT